MINAEKRRKIGRWVVIQIIPIAFICFTALYLLQETKMSFAIAMPLCIAWSAMGASVHYLSLKRSERWRNTAITLFLLFTIGAGFGLAKGFAWNFSSLKTCPVCGFVALEAQGERCPVCNVAFNGEEAKKEDFANLDEYLQAAQTMFFMPSEHDTTIDFFAPCDNCIAAFPKASDWKPSVTRQDILDVKAMAKPAD